MRAIDIMRAGLLTANDRIQTHSAVTSASSLLDILLMIPETVILYGVMVPSDVGSLT